MRQLILVSKDDVKGLMGGNNWEINANGSVTIGYDGKIRKPIGRPRGPYKKRTEKTKWQLRKERRETLPRPFKCPYCVKRFINGPGLGSHIKTKHPGKSYQNTKGR